MRRPLGFSILSIQGWSTTPTPGPIHLDSLHRTAGRGRCEALDRLGGRLLRQRDGRVDLGLFKTEVIRCHGPWRNCDAVEMATLEWVDWYNNRRLFEPLGDIPP